MSELINRYNKSFLGNQPIRVLQNNLIHQFERTNDGFLNLSKTVIKEKGLKPGIKYVVGDFPIFDRVAGHSLTPYLTADHEITIHESFLSYVWCICYSIYGLFNQISNLKMDESISESKVETALSIFEYGISIIKVFSVWDKHMLPNPELYTKESSEVIEKVNAIYLYAMNYILCHEFVHSERDHHKQIIELQSSPIEIEIEADFMAFSHILKGVNDTNRSTLKVGVLSGLCSLLFFRRDLGGKSHPATDYRIDSFLKFLDPDPNDSIWIYAAISYWLWDQQFGKGLTWADKAQGAKEYYSHIKEQLGA